MKRVTIQEVAQHAGVSTGSVSRVINGAANVTPTVAGRVRRAVRELGFVPDTAARAMRARRTRTIGVIVRDITIPALASFVRGVQAELQGRGYTTLISCSDDRIDRELELLRQMRRRGVDGLIMTTVDESSAALSKARLELDVPIVLMDRDDGGRVDSVALSHATAMQALVVRLAAWGHRRIGLIAVPDTVRPGRERVRGYQEGLAAAGLTPDPRLLRITGYTADAAYVHTCALLGLSAAPSAIIAGGIALLPGVLRAIEARGRRIPEDVSVVGSGDSDLAELFAPPISVVRWNYGRIASTCIELLLRRMERAQGPAPQHILIEPEFVSRGSCVPLNHALRSRRGKK